MDISNMAYEKKEDTIAYTFLQHMNELCCTICKLDFIDVHEFSAKSNFHWKIMKCRLLIYLVSDVIASPISGTEKYIFIITRKTFFESGKLENVLRHLKLVYQGQRPITMEVYKDCLLYTIQTKIAPLWNKVGQYFLQGKEFYNSMEPIKTLKIDILVQERDVCLVFRAESVNILRVKLEDFLPSLVVSHFLADPKGHIDLSHYDFPFVYVLPSTRRGKLVSVFKEIPECVFKDYDQMRRHWKNMYGYSLPKNKDGILFLEIKFPVPRSHSFIYPNICVMSGQLDIISKRNKECTVTKFMSDMIAKLPTICGKELKLSKHTFCNKQTSSINITSDILVQNKELITPLKRKYEFTLSAPLECSANCIKEIDENIETIPKSLKTQLTKIHDIHNTFQCNTNRAVLNTKNIECNENEGLSLNTTHTSNIWITKNDCNEAKTSRISNTNTAEIKQGTISKYFRNCKIITKNDKNESAPNQSTKIVTIKKKLLQAKLNMQEVVGSIHRCGENDKSNKLHQVKNNLLNKWLRNHSIPRNSYSTKAGLTKKILSHIRNTTMFKQFYM